MKTLLLILVAFSVSAQTPALDSITLAIEKDNQERAKRYDAIGESNFPFAIKQVSVSEIDAVGGVNVGILMSYYKKTKTIKYLYFTLVPYNAVGDRVSCDIRGYSEFTAKLTGPIKASNIPEGHIWGAAWYNNTVACIKLTKMRVEYTDGTSYTYINELPKLFADGLNNDCSYK